MFGKWSYWSLNKACPCSFCFSIARKWKDEQVWKIKGCKRQKIPCNSRRNTCFLTHSLFTQYYTHCPHVVSCSWLPLKWGQLAKLGVKGITFWHGKVQLAFIQERRDIASLTIFKDEGIFILLAAQTLLLTWLWKNIHLSKCCYFLLSFFLSLQRPKRSYKTFR